MQNANDAMRKERNEMSKARTKEQHNKQRFRIDNRQQHGNDNNGMGKNNTYTTNIIENGNDKNGKNRFHLGSIINAHQRRLENIEEGYYETNGSKESRIE